MTSRILSILIVAAATFVSVSRADAQDIYVPNYLDGTVTVLDAVSLETIATIPVSAVADPEILVVGDPSAVSFSADFRYAFVVLSNSDKVAVIDARTYEVVEYIDILPVAGDALIFTGPLGQHLFVTSCADPLS